MPGRLPARLEVSALIRRVEAAGGFAAVLHKGEPDSGTILIVVTEKGKNLILYERMPQADGQRLWQCSRRQGAEDHGEFSDYIARRWQQDPDVWVVELDVADSERFVP